MAEPHLTTASGIPVADNQNSVTAGERGPVLLQDFHLIEKLQHFHRERIPERVLHAVGSGAYGTFTVSHDISKFTKAKLFNAVGKKTDVFVRFSTVDRERGGTDLEAGSRGFAVRFYTEEGNWDLVANNTPMFFIRDAIKFPDLVHAHKRDPQTHVQSASVLWDFNSRSSETLHMLTMVMTSRGMPDGHRHMDGFGIHTFSMINAAGERVWVKWHLKTKQGIKNIARAEAERIAGRDPDYCQRDLYDAIKRGDFPKWDVKIQVMTEAERVAWELRTGWGAFDATKIWPHKDFPLIPVGSFELNRNPDNYHAEVEQACFSPAHVVPGLGYSPDKVLQGRLFAYHDASLYRVGTNHQQLPVNRPKCPVFNQQRDGYMTIVNPGGATNSDPVNAAGSNPSGLGLGEPGLALSGDAARYDPRGHTPDDFSQAGALFRLLPAEEKQVLFDNLADELARGIPKETIDRQLALFDRADAAYGIGVRTALAKKAVKTD